MKMIRLFLGISIFASVCTQIPLTAQTSAAAAQETVGIPWTGKPGITEIVSDIVARDVSAPKFPGMKEGEGREFPLVHRTNTNPLAPKVDRWPQIDMKTVPQDRLASITTQTVGVSFLAVQVSESGYLPPDSQGDVGPTQIVVHVNGRIKVFDKTGVLGSLNVTDTTFWSSVRNGADISDPHVRYDRLSGRWFIVAISIPASGANSILIAVSSGSTITNTSSFTFYQFQHDLVGTTPNTDTGGFADYPTLGVDANALYIGANIFNAAGTAFLGSSGYVVRKSTLVAGSLVVTPFRQFNNGSSAGIYTPQGVQNDDSTATEGYFIGVDAASYGLLVMRRISNPGGTPTISGNLNITVPTTTAPILQVHKGAAANRRLDALEDRLFAAMIKKNRQTGASSLWTAHNIEVNTSGVAAAGGGRNGSRWYEITNLTTTPTLNQSGTLYDPASTSPRGYWIPSVAMSGQGHMVLGASYASTNDYAGVVISGRYSSETPGTIQTPTLAVVASTAYNAQTTDGQRWGDYSQVGVDPTDDMTMWTFQEYCNATSSWGLRVVQLLAPPPAMPATASPATMNTGTSNAWVEITGTSSGGSGFFEPGTSFSKHLTASVSGSGVTVNSLAYTDPTHISLNLTVAGGATPGLRTITVTNPDGQSATSATGILNISNTVCGTITLAPASLPGDSIGVAYNQTVTASGGTAPYTYTVTSGSLPAGITLSSSGTLSGTPVLNGSYPITITATDVDFCTGNQPYTLTILGCPAITQSPASLPGGTAGSSYSQNIAASGGTSPYTFAVSNGTLPAGLTLSSAGLLSGTPTTFGTSIFTVTATDANTCTGDKIDTLVISPSGTSIYLSSLGVAYTQDFNSLASTGTSSAVPAGWLFSETGGNANTTYAAGTGSSNTGDTWSFGATGSSERAFGGLLSSSLVPTIGASFTNATGSAITSVTISYNGEQWRLGAASRVAADSLLFQLSTDATSLTTGAWTNYRTLNFASPILSGTVGALDGNASANRRAISATISGLNIPNGATFFIRWTDFNVASSDDGLAVDDFSLTPGGSTQTNPTVTGLATPAAVNKGSATLLTATVTPGTNPTSTGITVIGDLSSIGGSASQSFYDDGTHGDVTVGDNTFSFQATVTSGTALGAKSLALTVNDAQLRTAAGTISLVVTCPVISLTAPPLAGGTVGTAYSQSITASGGGAPYTYSISTGSLPNGLTLSSGTIQGTPAASGTFNFTVQALDQNGCTGSQPYSIIVACPAITVSPTNLPNPSPAVAYNQLVTASGGRTPYTFTLSSGALPSGITLSTGGTLSGTTSSSGTFNFTVQASDSFGCLATRVYSFVMGCPAISILPGVLSGGVVADRYLQLISASGGTAPYTFSITAGNLPMGLSLMHDSIAGAPMRAGIFTFTLTAADTFGCSGSRADSIIVVCPTITIAPSVLPHASLGASYSESVTASGGVAPYLYSASGGGLPAGLSLSAGGVVTGTPTASGLFIFMVSALDHDSCEGSNLVTLQVDSVAIDSVAFSLQAGWNMVSNPLLVENDSVHVLFPSKLGNVFTFSTGSYIVSDRLTVGPGYWLKFASPEVTTLRGNAVDRDTVNVSAGWNMIGSLSRNIPAPSLLSIGCAILSPIFAFEGAYHIVDSIKAGIGYWVKVNANGRLVLSEGGAAIRARMRAGEVVRRDQASHLIVSDHDGHSQVLDLAPAETYAAINSQFCLDLPPLPPQGLFDARFSSGRWVEMLPSSDRGTLSYRIALQGVGQGLSARLEENGQKDFRYILSPITDFGVKKGITLGRTAVAITEPHLVALALTVKGKSALPAAYALNQNYPNPFNPTTTVGFDLPEPSVVSLAVFNILGEEVATLSRREIFEAGSQEVQFDATSLPSGIYFYRLLATPVNSSSSLQDRSSFLMTRKMILVR